MTSFSYAMTGKWFKGNTHIHSKASDGGLSFAELAQLYKSANYDFLFRTDHWLTSEAEADSETYPLLWLDGIELDGADQDGTVVHVVCLGAVRGIQRERGLEAAMTAAFEQGAITILAHPHWSGNSLQVCGQRPYAGVEVYNHVCHWLNGKSNGLVHWEAMLNHNVNALAFASDDTHLSPLHPGWNGGWIMVNAAECARSSILAAIRCGSYYSSCGPEIYSLNISEGSVQVKSSPVAFIRIVGPAFRGGRVGSFDGSLVTDASFNLPAEWKYAYLELEDQNGRRAWTNNLLAPAMSRCSDNAETACF